MDSNMQWLIDDLLDGESIENFTPKSKLEAYVKAALLKSGTDGLDIPVNRLDALLYWNADKAPDNYASAVEDGRTQEWSDFWDDFQQNGARTYYYYNTFSGWTDRMFKPKYDMILGKQSANGIFSNVKITNMKQIFQDCGVVLDTSKATSMSESFAYSPNLTHLPVINTTGCSSLVYLCCNDYKLVEIEKLIFKEDGSQTTGNANSMFLNNYALSDVVIEGTIGMNMTFKQSSKLTHDSLMSIINHLKDYSGTEETRTLTLHATAKARLTEAEIAIATEKGWTVA